MEWNAKRDALYVQSEALIRCAGFLTMTMRAQAAKGSPIMFAAPVKRRFSS